MWNKNTHVAQAALTGQNPTQEVSDEAPEKSHGYIQPVEESLTSVKLQRWSRGTVISSPALSQKLADAYKTARVEPLE